MTSDTSLIDQLQRAERRRKLRAAALTLPLLAFLLVVFLVPLAQLLIRAIENPEVADALPRTGEVLADWDRDGLPADAAYAALLQDLSSIEETADAGVLARRLNSEAPGARSLIMGTYRALPTEPPATPASARQTLIDLDPRWEEPEFWQAIAKNSTRWTPDYLLTAVDLKRSAQGEIVAVGEDEAAFRAILIRTFEISATVTLFALLIGYPLAYWLSTLSERQANVMLILVLLPFWTSVLVRIAAKSRESWEVCSRLVNCAICAMKAVSSIGFIGSCF